MGEVVAALSYALDLTEGQPPGHTARVCRIGMRIGRETGLTPEELGDLYYALLLKDSGCSSNASRLFHILGADEIRAKRDVKTADWTKLGWESLRFALSHVAVGRPFLERVRRLVAMAASREADSRDLVKIRCERGASVARRLGFGEGVAGAIHALDEHWNGRGYPEGRRGREIPRLSQILLLAQTLEVFLRHAGPEGAVEVARKRSGRWFDPELVRAAVSAAARGALWAGLEEAGLAPVVEMEPEERRITADEAAMDRICLAFAEVVDAKSPFTYQHSNGVARAAVAMARQFGMSGEEIRFLRRAALLHDIGKLSVSNAILEKPGKLTGGEWEAVKKHPYYTLEVLKRVPGFEELSEVAASHHEKLDGTGYFRGWGAERMSRPARMLVVADIFDALAARRPYREALPVETVFGILEKDAPKALDADCVEALKQAVRGGMAEDLGSLSEAVGERTAGGV
jgi:putative nucleotidyltransferase with HDIG domain